MVAGAAQAGETLKQTCGRESKPHRASVICSLFKAGLSHLCCASLFWMKVIKAEWGVIVARQQRWQQYQIKRHPSFFHSHFHSDCGILKKSKKLTL